MSRDKATWKWLANNCVGDPVEWVMLQRACLVTDSLGSQAEHIHVIVESPRPLQANAQSKGRSARDAVPTREREMAVSVNGEALRQGTVHGGISHHRQLGLTR